MQTRRGVVALGMMCALAGCGGYTFVKKSTLAAHRLPSDSVRIASLEAELAKLRIQREADSTRYADLLKEPPPPVPQPAATANLDTLLKARDAEIQELRDQLSKADEEIKRIKRRLGNPRG